MDLSLTSTGVAGVERNSEVAGWVDRIRPKKKVGFQRLREVRDRAMEFIIGADLVIVEGLAFASKTGHQSERAGLWHIVMERVDRDYLWVEVAPTVLKKYATGRGNAEKDTVLAAVVRRFPMVEVTGNDEADALILAAMGADHFRSPLVPMPDAHREAMGTVKWPPLVVA